MESTLYYLHALSPLHVGTGQDAGAIDLPIARERATNLPYVPGTGLKGMLRAELHPDNREQGQERGYIVNWFEEAKRLNYAFPDDKEWEILFGPEKVADDNAFAGALSFGDAHLLCLPVRSLAGTFAWATCRFILERYAREAEACGINTHAVPFVPEGKALTAAKTELVHADKVVLEDLYLDAQAGAEEWAEHIAQAVFKDNWQNLFKERFVILPDGVLDFLAETATDIRARIKINLDTRTVDSKAGALWWEENLPAETLLFGLVAADRSRNKDENLNAKDVLAKLPPGPVRVQLGGKMSVGRGLVNWIKGGVQ